MVFLELFFELTAERLDLIVDDIDRNLLLVLLYIFDPFTHV